MYKHEPFKPKVRLWVTELTFNLFDRVIASRKYVFDEFENLEIAIKTIMGWRDHPYYMMYGLLHPGDRHWGGSANFVYELIDQYGDLIEPWQIKPIHDRIYEKELLRRRISSRWWLRHKASYKFRYDEVPYISRRRSGGGYRAIRTLTERRAYDRAMSWNDQEEGIRIRVRAKRNPTMLPNSWDDIPRSRNGNGWKQYRRTRWKK